MRGSSNFQGGRKLKGVFYPIKVNMRTRDPPKGVRTGELKVQVLWTRGFTGLLSLETHRSDVINPVQEISTNKWMYFIDAVAFPLTLRSWWFVDVAAAAEPEGWNISSSSVVIATWRDPSFLNNPGPELEIVKLMLLI